MSQDEIVAGLRAGILRVEIDMLHLGDVERTRRILAGERAVDVFRSDELVHQSIAQRDEARALIAAGAEWVGHEIYAP